MSWHGMRRPDALAGTFPFAAPAWPTSVPRPPLERALGMDYDTAWARRYPARFARMMLQRVVTAPVLRALADPHCDGLDRIAHLNEPVIFAANHTSHLDAPVLLGAIPQRWRHRTIVAGAADYFFDSRVKAATLALALNAVPIERQRVSRTSAARLEELLRSGWSLLIFPEGGRSPDGWAQPHRAGAAWLGARTGCPVVPVHLEGTGQILPRGARRPRPGTTHVTFGRPLRPGAGEGARKLAARLEAAVAALADEQTTDWWTATRRAAQRTTPSLTGPDAGAWRRSWALGLGSRRAGVASEGRWPRR